MQRLREAQQAGKALYERRARRSNNAAAEDELDRQTNAPRSKRGTQSSNARKIASRKARGVDWIDKSAEATASESDASDVASRSDGSLVTFDDNHGEKSDVVSSDEGESDESLSPNAYTHSGNDISVRSAATQRPSASGAHLYSDDDTDDDDSDAAPEEVTQSAARQLATERRSAQEQARLQCVQTQ